MAYLNLLDIAKKNCSDGQVGVIEEASRAHPEMTKLPSRTIPGINFKTLVRTSLGRTTGSFRAANAGTTPIKSVYENRLVETFILDPRWKVDKAVAISDVDGPGAAMAREAAGALEGEMQGFGSQIYYGSGNNTSGFPGFIDVYDSTNMVVDAGGTTATTGSSVWFVRAGYQDVQLVWGAGGAMTFSAVQELPGLDPNDSTKELTWLYQNMLARPGLMVGSIFSLCRIKKLTADSGKGMTDALANQALAKFPVGKGPNLCFATQRSIQQWQASRTATNPTGQPAPWPIEVAGVDGQMIPILPTEALTNTESLTL
jgi:hypothetical protein